MEAIGRARNCKGKTKCCRICMSGSRARPSQTALSTQERLQTSLQWSLHQHFSLVFLISVLTLPSTRRDPGADCVSDNFPHVPLLFLCCSSSPAWLSPASTINFIPTVVLLLSRRTRGAHGAGNEACCPHPRPAEGGSAFGNVPTGSGVGEDTQICERPAEAVPASRSVGCLNFYVPLLRC